MRKIVQLTNVWVGGSAINQYSLSTSKAQPKVYFSKKKKFQKSFWWQTVLLPYIALIFSFQAIV